MVQNALARTITRSPRSIPTSQLLCNLHWLPIHKRINYKFATLSYKVLSTQQPAYLNCNLISYHQLSRSLRSSSQSLLQVSRVKTDFGRRAISSAAPQIWNHIPAGINVTLSLKVIPTPDDPRCYGNKILDTIGYNSAYIKYITETFAYNKGFGVGLLNDARQSTTTNPYRHGNEI